MGEFIRLSPLYDTDLPSHPEIDGGHSADSRPSLAAFVYHILLEGEQFAESFHTDFHKVGKRTAPPSAAMVHNISRYVSPAEMSLRGDAEHIKRQSPVRSAQTREFWAGRRSYHEDRRAPGTANWQEFCYGLRDDHAQKEMDMTPTLYDSRKIVDWEVQLSDVRQYVTGYANIKMEIREMCHALPFPLAPRCFPVLYVVADVRRALNQVTDGFIRVTIPVCLSALRVPACFYAAGRNVNEGCTTLVRTPVVLAVYTAVQRTKKVREEDVPACTARQGKVGQIEWSMAVASDAKGFVPRAIQRALIHGVITKDVSLFIDWIRKVEPISAGLCGQQDIDS